jgi:hypothetical protein
MGLTEHILATTTNDERDMIQIPKQLWDHNSVEATEKKI